MKLILKILVTSALVLLISHILPGVHVAGFTTALFVAIVLGLLNIFIKPILIILTLPVTILTLGLFLLVINALIILLCTNIVGGFVVDSFWIALLFSIVLSLLQSIMNGILGEGK
ncbi:phage holin family protein [Flavobacterium granuli]|uniref:Membrane protein n=1 Tax=Flavobacterium granuli TaxID=280093 RepID=A0A1M5MTT7_9FLAO|nr:phage holin family protein [Flavobacterium granuli]PRZ25062.1 putative membrane protein [Flavobacterium granuli]SHG80203.1 putative membrane protein [Flavobacterium granuli]